MFFWANLKLSPRFYNPFQNEAKVGQVAYHLELPPGSFIHNVFHVSQLRKHLGDLSVIAFTLPPTMEDIPVLPQPEIVLDCPTIVKGKYKPCEEVRSNGLVHQRKMLHGRRSVTLQKAI